MKTRTTGATFVLRVQWAADGLIPAFWSTEAAGTYEAVHLKAAELVEEHTTDKILDVEFRATKIIEAYDPGVMA